MYPTLCGRFGPEAVFGVSFLFPAATIGITNHAVHATGLPIEAGPVIGTVGYISMYLIGHTMEGVLEWSGWARPGSRIVMATQTVAYAATTGALAVMMPR